MRFLFRLVACLVFLSPLLGLWWLESGSPGQPNRVLPEGEKLLGVYPQALAVLTVKQTSGESPRFTLWDVGSQKQRAFGEDLGVLDPAPSRAAKGDQFSKHGRVWATRNGSQVALWNVWQSKSLGAVTVRENAAEPFALSYDGSVLAYLDAQQQEVRVRDVEQQAEQCRIPASVASVALSPYGKMVAAPGAGSTVNLLHASSGEPLTVLPGGARPPRVMRFSSSGRFLAAAIAPDPNDMKSETEIVLWDVAEKRTILATRAAASQVSSLRFSHEDSLLRMHATNPNDSRTDDPTDGDPADNVAFAWRLDVDSPAPVRSSQVPLVLTADGKRMAVLDAGSADAVEGNPIRVADCSSGDVLAQLPAPKGSRPLAFSPDGRRLAIHLDSESVPTEDSLFETPDVFQRSTRRQVWLATWETGEIHATIPRVVSDASSTDLMFLSNELLVCSSPSADSATTGGRVCAWDVPPRKVGSIVPRPMLTLPALSVVAFVLLLPWLFRKPKSRRKSKDADSS